MPNKYVRRHDGTTSSAPQDIELVVAIPAAADAVDVIPWQAFVPCRLDSVSVTFGVTSTSGTLQIEKVPVGTAVGSGTDLLTATVSLSGTAGVTVNGSVSTVATDTAFAVGDRVGLDFGGTVTGLLRAYVTLRFRRLQSTNSPY